MEYEKTAQRGNLQEKALQDNNVGVRLYDIIRCLITLLAVVASPMLVTSLINPIDQTLEQQQQQQKPIPTEDDFKIHQRQKDDTDS